MITVHVLAWAALFGALSLWNTLLIATRPGYWGGASPFIGGIVSVVRAAVQGRGACRRARIRYQFVCLVCAAAASAAMALSLLGVYFALPGAAEAVQAVVVWFVVLMAAWALGAFVTGREADAA